MTPPARIPHDVGLLLALRRVRDGRVTARGWDSFNHNQRPFPRVLIPYLRELLDHGQARLDAQADTIDTSRVLITEAGQALLAELEETNPHSPDPVDAHREVGAQATESGGWSRTPACDDHAGRPRHMEFFLTEKGFLALRVPPGEIAVITPKNFREVKKAFDEGHLEMTARWFDR